jgi:hypothetical protein
MQISTRAVLSTLLRVATIASLLLIVVFGGHGGGFMWHLLVEVGFVEGWGIYSVVAILGSILLLLGLWLYARTLTSVGVGVLAFGILLLARTTEGGVLTLISAIPFALFSILLLVLCFRRRPSPAHLNSRTKRSTALGIHGTSPR